MATTPFSAPGARASLQDPWIGCSSWWSDPTSRGSTAARRPSQRDQNLRPYATRLIGETHPDLSATEASSREALERVPALQVSSSAEGAYRLSPSPSLSTPMPAEPHQRTAARRQPPRLWLFSPFEGSESSNSSTFSTFVSQLAHYAVGTPAGMAATSATVTTLGLLAYWRFFRRIKNAEFITPRELRWRKTLVGTVTHIGDADGFRLYHQPGPPLLRRWLHPVPSSIKSLKENTISVRLAGADAPELAHFGHKEQPFAREAKEELTKLVLGKTVRCEVAHVDQYKRIVATPYVWQAPYVLGTTNVSLTLVQKGLATVYRQSGAAYGPASVLWKIFAKARDGLGRLERAERRAKKRKLGIWSQGKKHETPEMYKKRIKAE